MQRQKSILSFFRKPSPENQSSGPGETTSGGRRVPTSSFPASHTVGMDNRSAVSAKVDLSLEVKGTDTPPEKVPRKVLPANFSVKEENKGASLFSSIMHKFVKVEDGEKVQKATERTQVHADSYNFSLSDKVIGIDRLPNPGPTSSQHYEDKVLSSNLTVDRNYALDIKSEDDITRPETPGTRPFVPYLKRIQEDSPKQKDRSDSSLLMQAKE